MKYIGIDFGEKRVGISLSDENGKMAFPKEVMINDKNIVEKIASFAKENNVSSAILGESKNYQGEDNKIMGEILKVKQELEKVGLKVILEPEFMTSMQVEKTFGKTEMLDASSATIILQSFLDRMNNQKKVESESAPREKITYDDFKKVEMKVGKILNAEKVLKSDKLLKLTVDFAEGVPRQIVSGIATSFSPEVLVGKKVVFITNLLPRQLMGLESNGMILAGKGDDKLALLEMPDFIKEGTSLS